MSKYKVGDRVKVREWDDLVAEYDWRGEYLAMPGNVAFVDPMLAYCGKEVTISKVDMDEEGGYKIQEDDYAWWWSDDMFEDIEPDTNQVNMYKF